MAGFDYYNYIGSYIIITCEVCLSPLLEYEILLLFFPSVQGCSTHPFPLWDFLPRARVGLPTTRSNSRPGLAGRCWLATFSPLIISRAPLPLLLISLSLTHTHSSSLSFSSSLLHVANLKCFLPALSDQETWDFEILSLLTKQGQERTFKFLTREGDIEP